MRMSQFASTFLNASDIESPTHITISSVQEEKVGTNENSPVLYCEELDQGIVLKKTNISQLITLLGTEESDEWIGRKVVVFNDRSVMFEGRRVGGIRFRASDSTGDAATPPPASRKGGKGKPGDTDFPGH